MRHRWIVQGFRPLGDIAAYAEPTFIHLAGLLMVSFFNHNLILTIMANHRYPEHQSTDLVTAFALIAFTYAGVGAVVLFINWGDVPMAQSLLDMLPATSLYGLSTRVVVLLQMATLAPLVNYIIRIQLFGQLFNSPWPGMAPVTVQVRAATSATCSRHGSLSCAGPGAVGAVDDSVHLFGRAGNRPEVHGRHLWLCSDLPVAHLGPPDDSAARR